MKTALGQGCLCLTASIWLFVLTTASGQNLLPNPSFEEGAASPAGWILRGGTNGHWATFGRTGQRCLSVFGSGKDSFAWRAEGIPLQPGAHYRLRFWARRDPQTTGGCVVAGTRQVNRDFHLTTEWQPYSFAFQAPDGATNDYLRLGQWEVKGPVYFDDVELLPVLTAHRQLPPGVELGAGESVGQGKYRALFTFGDFFSNHHRPLRVNRCGFNSDRWTFAAGSEVIYEHHLEGSRLSGARLQLNLNYYVAGSLRVEASRDGATWREAALYDGQNKSGAVELPAAWFPADRLLVRLRGIGKDCNLQVNRYEFEARLTGPPMEARGATTLLALRRKQELLGFYLHEIKFDPAQGGFVIAATITNRGVQPLRLRAELAVEDKVAADITLPPLDAGARWTTNFLVQAEQPGRQEVVLILRDAAGRIMLEGVASLALGILQDPRFGYWLNDREDTVLWWCESGAKVGRDRRPPAATPGKARPVFISAARGEHEAVQVVISPKRDGRLVNVAMLASPKEKANSRRAPAFSLHEVAYVQVTVPTDSTCEPGWYPDPLPPLRLPLELRQGQNQPLWLTVYVPTNAAAGRHEARLRVETDHDTCEIPVVVDVFNFTLPQETHLRSALGLSSSSINRYHQLKEPAHRQAVYDLYLKNFAEHRISPYSFFPYAPIEVRFTGETPNQRARVDFTRFDQAAARWLDEARFNSFRLPLKGMGGGTFHSRHLGSLGGHKEGTPEFARLFKDYLSQVEAHLRQKGWLDKAYVYWFDEPDPKDYEFVAEGMKRIKAAAPGLRRMLTEQPEPALMGQVDIWCALTPEWTPEKVAARRAAGEEVWWYICCAPKAPYITEFIDHPGTEMRLWPWQSWQYGVQGILIWETTYWTSSSAFPGPALQDPWQDPMSYVSGYDFQAGQIGYWGNGDGRFLYPPRGAHTNSTPCLEGPVNSIRWENLRDGLEDYEYFWLLRKALDRPAKSPSQRDRLLAMRGLLTVPPTISSNLTRFTTDPRLILSHREKLARAIEQLQ